MGDEIGSGLRAQGSGLRVQGSGLRAQGSGLRAQDSGLRLCSAKLQRRWGAGYWVLGTRFKQIVISGAGQQISS